MKLREPKSCTTGGDHHAEAKKVIDLAWHSTNPIFPNMQIYQFTNGKETYLIDAWNILGARRKLELRGLDPAHFALVNIEWRGEIPAD
jgi:hypothetical protein